MWNEFSNEELKATLLKEEIGIYSRARQTITSLLVFNLLHVVYKV